MRFPSFMGMAREGLRKDIGCFYRYGPLVKSGPGKLTSGCELIEAQDAREISRPSAKAARQIFYRSDPNLRPRLRVISGALQLDEEYEVIRQHDYLPVRRGGDQPLGNSFAVYVVERRHRVVPPISNWRLPSQVVIKHFVPSCPVWLQREHHHANHYGGREGDYEAQRIADLRWIPEYEVGHKSHN